MSKVTGVFRRLSVLIETPESQMEARLAITEPA